MYSEKRFMASRHNLRCAWVLLATLSGVGCSARGARDPLGSSITGKVFDETPIVRQIIGNHDPQMRTGTGCTSERMDFQLLLSPPDPPRMPLRNQQISLTYDDGPGPHTKAIAQYLADRRIPATFFVNGCRVRSIGGCEVSPLPPSVLKDIVDLGHRLGNHTETHAALWRSGVNVTDELTQTQSLIDPLISDGFYFFRPPNNCWTPEAEAALRSNTTLRKLTGPFFYDSGGADWYCSQADMNWSPAACALAYFRDMPTQRRGIIQMHDRNPNDISSDYAFRVTRCLVEGIGSAACPDPGASAFSPVGGPPSEAERPLFSGFQFVPLDAIPGVTSGAYAKGSFVPAGFIQPELSDEAGLATEPSRYGTIRLGDVNGDGVSDVCARRSDGVICALGVGDGSFGSFKLWSSALSDAMGYSPREYGTTFQLADVNADDKADACIRAVAGVHCLLSTGVMFQTAVATPEFSDALHWNAAQSYYGSIRAADVNGDERADICGRGKYGVICVLSTGIGFASPRIWLAGFTDAQDWLPPAYGSTIQLGDINGDRRADVCGRGHEGVLCATSNGTAFGELSLWTTWQFTDTKGWGQTESQYGSVRLADIDGDGRADYCGRDANGVVCAVAMLGKSGFFNPRYVVNTDLFDDYGWSPSEYGTTLIFGPLRPGARRADVCARGVDGLLCWLSRY